MNYTPDFFLGDVCSSWITQFVLVKPCSLFTLVKFLTSYLSSEEQVSSDQGTLVFCCIYGDEILPSYMDVSKNRGKAPKMDGLKNGKPY